MERIYAYRILVWNYFLIVFGLNTEYSGCLIKMYVLKINCAVRRWMKRNHDYVMAVSIANCAELSVPHP
jgi:hypothetical protein